MQHGGGLMAGHGMASNGSPGRRHTQRVALARIQTR